MTKRTQEQKIVSFLKTHEWITQKDANKLGILRLASRVFDMSDKGYVFIREYIMVENSDGSKSRIARYSIVKYPEKEVYNVG